MNADDHQGNHPQLWESYEDVARYVLQQICDKVGLADVEGKQKIQGKDTIWEIDAKGVRRRDGAIILIECRRYTTSRLAQEQAGAFAYRILDTGAAGGIIVSPLPLQKGAAAVAKNRNIAHVQLTAESTRERWVAQIAELIHHGITNTTTVKSKVSVEMTVFDANGNVRERRNA